MVLIEWRTFPLYSFTNVKLFNFARNSEAFVDANTKSVKAVDH